VIVDTSHRIDAFRRFMEERDIALSIITAPDDLYYLGGFKAIVYSRPIHLAISPDRLFLIIPALEEVHARAEAAVDELLVYYEHPERADAGTSPVQHLDHVVGRLAKRSILGVQANSMSLALAGHLTNAGFKLADIGPKIEVMRAIKDDAEIEIMLEAGRLASLGVGASLAALHPGITELDIDGVGDVAILEDISAKHPGATVDLFAMSPTGPVRTVMPHVFSNTRAMQKGDILIHSRQVALNGYRGESERTCFLGKPDARQTEVFQLMLEAQLAGLDALEPGVAMKDVDQASRQVFQKAGLGEYFLHRTGHGLGLSVHEPPFLRFDNDDIVEVGMVFTVEPAVFIPGLGGFRHSDTTIVTSDGNRITTEHPKDIESMTF
jgi:Xaa-Pro aminopeptidase